MEEAKVHCPRCHESLRVPESAAGRPARCPKCRKVFRIPEHEDLFEETISSWIEDDLDQLQRKHEEYWDSVASIKAQRVYGKRSIDSPRKFDDVHLSGDGQSTDGAEPGAEGAPESTATPVAGVETAQPVQSATTSTESSPEAKAEASKPAPAEAAPPADEQASDEAQRADDASSDGDGRAKASGSAASGASRSRGFAMPTPSGAGAPRITDLKQEFDSGSSRPLLAVESCTTNGVELAFDWKCLEHEGFRTSMPVRCVFTGEDDPRKLLSRPLAFTDRSGATVRSAQEVETKYQHKIVSGQSPRDLVRVMGLIDGIAKPFNNPVPYYVEQHHTSYSIKCWTTRRGEAYTCHLVIPDGWYALEWLARVNGVCGEEYEALAGEVAMLSSDAWNSLSEQCRSRIEVWCRFLPMEEFRLYLTDADFGRRDEGLAGVVVTNRRLIYCKYHHRGEIELEHGGTLLVKRNGVWSNLVHEYDGSRTRVVKIHSNRIPELIEELSDTPLRVEQVEVAAEEQAQA